MLALDTIKSVINVDVDDAMYIEAEVFTIYEENGM